jgi:flagella basal body P-ring formation protein FlgA
MSKLIETLVNFCQTTRRYNPEDSNIHTHHCENLRSYLPVAVITINRAVVVSRTIAHGGLLGYDIVWTYR